eukprot:gene18123-24563_t
MVNLGPGMRLPPLTSPHASIVTRENLGHGEVVETTCLSPFQAPPNCCEPSPDGQWLAVCCDEPYILLIPSGASPEHDEGEDGMLKPGCQYCRFNSNTSYLAASSDTIKAVYVFDLNSLSSRQNPVRRPLFTLCHNQPCLALSFSPQDPFLLAYAEEYQKVHIVDIRKPMETPQRVILSPHGTPAAVTFRDMPRVNGLLLVQSAVKKEPLLVVATQTHVHVALGVVELTPSGLTWRCLGRCFHLNSENGSAKPSSINQSGPFDQGKNTYKTAFSDLPHEVVLSIIERGCAPSGPSSTQAATSLRKYDNGLSRKKTKKKKKNSRASHCDWVLCSCCVEGAK